MVPAMPPGVCNKEIPWREVSGSVLETYGGRGADIQLGVLAPSSNAQTGVSWCLVGDPSGLLLCVPLLPRREARGSARRQQDPSRRHDRVYQSGQPQGSRSVSF